MTGEEFLSGASSEQRAHFVEHLLLGGNLSFFRQIPCGAQCTTAGNDAHLDEWVGVFAEP